MRRRLFTLVLATTALALTLLGVILITVIWTAMGSATQDRAAATAKVAAAALEESIESEGFPTDATVAEYVRDGAHLTATLPDGRVLTSGPGLDGPAYTAEATHERVTVVARIPMSINAGKVASQALIVVLVSLVALSLAMLVALFYARRITRPLEEFAELAGRIATGDRREITRRYGVPELDAVAEVLDAGVTNFNALLENERRVTTEASHQLKTPLTALSLRLEEILATDDLEVVHHEAVAALGQVERLSGVVDEVVGITRGSHLASRVVFGVDDLVASQLTEWGPAFRAAGRSLARIGITGIHVLALRGAQAQALATLLENSLNHGQGATTVRVRATGGWVVLEVADEGPGVPEGLDDRVFERSVSGAESSGLGLALARTLVAADGGRLEMLSARPAVFAMFLRTDPHATTGAGAASVPVADPAAPERAGSGGSAAVDPAQAEVAMASSSAASTSSGNTQRR